MKGMEKALSTSTTILPLARGESNCQRVVFCVIQAVLSIGSLLSFNQTKEGKKMRMIKLRRAGAVLAIIGGITFAIGAAAVWVPYVTNWMPPWGFVPPLYAFIGFVLALLIVLGGIFIVGDRNVIGGYLAIACGIASIFVMGPLVTSQTLAQLFPPRVTAVLGLTLTLVCPILGGALGLMGKQNETKR